jgi:Flp pilus assembly protein CpaB
VRRQPLFLSRLALRRRPILFWAFSALVATTCAVVVGGLTARAEQAAARYGGLQPVAIVQHPVAVGDELGDDDVRVERVPRAFVPAGAMTDVPEGRTVLAPLVPGEVLVADRVAPEGLRGVAALLPEDSLAMAVPSGAAALRVAVGDVVDVLATAGDGSTRVVAGEALVVDVSDQTVTVAVGERAATAVATALTQATVTLALTGG